MFTKLNQFLDVLSNYFAHRKGLLPILGIGLIILNFILQFLHLGWITDTNLFLHLGIILAIIGIMLAWAL
jgi:hypothetical protein